jgi:hypothetical protein
MNAIAITPNATPPTIPNNSSTTMPPTIPKTAITHSTAGPKSSVARNWVRAYRSEMLLLNRKRMWIIAGLTTVAFTAFATALLTATAKPAAEGGLGEGIPLELFAGPGGATLVVTWAVAFGFILVLAAFTSRIGNEFSRGTFRTALLHHHGRWSLISGKMAALMTVTVALLALGLATGALTAAIVAPGQDIDTTGWFGAEALGDTLADFGRMVGWAAGFALIGTTLAVLVRSTSVALGIGVLWFGPIENVIGEGRDWAQRWFPGQLLRAVVAPDAPGAVSSGTAAATLAAYAAVCIAVVAIVIQRRDVTA